MKDKALIIARFNEKLGWLQNPLLDDFDKIIYNKGTGKGGIKLENVGHEAHSYLTHIVLNYEKLHSQMVFCQGNPFDHIKPPSKFLDDLNKPLPEFYTFGSHETHSVCGPTTFKRNGANIFQPNDAKEIYNLCQKIKPMKSGYEYKISVAHFAIFSVTQKLIHKYPKSFYEDLLKFTASNEFGAYALEQLWKAIFYPNSLI